MGIDALGRRFERLRLPAPEAVRRMAASLRDSGQLTPLLASEQSSGLELLDGFKRLQAAPMAGLESLRVWPVRLEGPDAKLAMITANASSAFDALEEAWLIRSLYREDGWTQPRIAKHLGRHKSWVNRRLALSEQLSRDLEADLKLGLLSPTTARELARLPRGNQTEVARRVMEKGLTTRETAQLVHAVIEASPEELPGILSGPSGSRAQGCRRRRSSRSPAEQLVTDVASIERASSRMQALLHCRPYSTYEAAAAELITTALAQLRPVLQALEASIERFTTEKDCQMEHTAALAAESAAATSVAPASPRSAPGTRASR